MDVPEIDPNFEPQTRARSNTWPLRPKVELLEDPPGHDARTPTGSEDGRGPGVDVGECGGGVGAPLLLSAASAAKDPLGLTKAKTSSRRNAWGNLSYADLITKAIQSAPDQRLTLSQIYDWMVQNVPYFKDKGDSNSSAGWKVGALFFSVTTLTHQRQFRHNPVIPVDDAFLWHAGGSELREYLSTEG